MWIEESTYQTARKLEKRYFNKTMNQWTYDIQNNNR